MRLVDHINKEKNNQAIIYYIQQYKQLGMDCKHILSACLYANNYVNKSMRLVNNENREKHNQAIISYIQQYK